MMVIVMMIIIMVMIDEDDDDESNDENRDQNDVCFSLRREKSRSMQFCENLVIWI